MPADVKTFRASSIREALQRVRRELGPEAAVLATRQLPGGLWGRLVSGGCRIEVQASRAVPVPTRFPQSSVPGDPGMLHAADGQQPSSVPAADEVDHRTRLRRQLAARSSPPLLSDLIVDHDQRDNHDLPVTLFQIFTQLLDAAVDEQCARQLVETIRRALPTAQLARTAAVQACLADVLRRSIRVLPARTIARGKRRVIALVGPTGVGKTTTVAKLAADFRLRRNYHVGLISCDNYRLAAPEQLRAYAEIMDLPLAVVSTPGQMQQAMADFADCDVVLVDTAGRSPRQPQHMQELHDLIRQAPADEVHLVLGSNSASRYLTDSLDAFAQVEPTALLLTKLDETAAPGNVLALLCRGELPLSYTTHGQHVPDDIQRADIQQLIEPLLPKDQEPCDTAPRSPALDADPAAPSARSQTGHAGVPFNLITPTSDNS
jgi:flagellar biosynthesis protein FlhF